MESFPDIRVGVDPSPVEEECLKNSVFLENDASTKQFGDVSEVFGTFTTGSGILTGRAKIKFKDGKFFIGYFKDGVLHGFARW